MSRTPLVAGRFPKLGRRWNHSIDLSCISSCTQTCCFGQQIQFPVCILLNGKQLAQIVLIPWKMDLNFCNVPYSPTEPARTCHKEMSLAASPIAEDIATVQFGDGPSVVDSTA